MGSVLKINKSHAQAVLIAAAVALVGGCSPGTNNNSTPPTATTPAGSSQLGSATPTVPATTAPPPTTPPPLVLTTPQAAAEHLYNAWKANDKPTARLAASSAAVDALFAKKWKASTYFFGGCTEPVAPSECDYNWAGGIIAMKIAGDKTAGFRVTAVSTGSAG